MIISEGYRIKTRNPVSYLGKQNIKRVPVKRVCIKQQNESYWE